MTEKEKMLAGKLYFAEDEELSGLRRLAAIYATSLMRPMKMKNRAGGKSFEVCSDISGAIPAYIRLFIVITVFPSVRETIFMPITIASFWMSAR